MPYFVQCVSFSTNRLQTLAGHIGDINVTITGSRLGCGYNLYMTLLTVAQSNTWQGRWSGCTLSEIGGDDNREVCSYWCRSSGYWEEIQVRKVPKSPEEVDWEPCHVSLAFNSDDENNIRGSLSQA